MPDRIRDKMLITDELDLTENSQDCIFFYFL